MLTLLLAACSPLSGSGTAMEFSFHPVEPGDYAQSKLLYVDQGAKNVSLDAALKLDGGEVTVQVTDLASDAVLWSQSFSGPASFTIELGSFLQETECSLAIDATDTASLSLRLNSACSFVKQPEKPSVPAHSKPER